MTLPGALLRLRRPVLPRAGDGAAAPPTLDRELVIAFAIVFAGALLMAATGTAIVLTKMETLVDARLYMALLIVVDVIIFAIFGRFLLRRRVLRPLAQMIDAVEGIAHGDYNRRVPAGETAEIARLGDAVNRMAARLVAHQEQLAANIRSLEQTNRQLTETRDELLRIEKMASVGRLGAGLAHEVGNPLGAVIGYLAVLKRTAVEGQVELIEAAEEEARRIDRIIRGLLDYARPREVHAEPIAVNRVVEETVELLRMQGRFGRIQVDMELAMSLPPVLADRYQLQQVLVNLLMNAADAVAEVEEGAIVIQTSRKQVPARELVPTRRKDDPPGVDYSHRRRFHDLPRMPREDPFPGGGTIVLISIADNGHGIPPELLDQIFEPFVTTKEPGKGTGLGLAVAARLVDGMGGTIRAENWNGQGATFTVFLPVAAGEGAPTES